MTKEENKPVTIEDLGKFTEQVLLPAIHSLIKEEDGKLRHELKDYIDEKLADTKGDIIYYIKHGKEREKDKKWKEKATEIFENNKLAAPQELQKLKGLAV